MKFTLVADDGVVVIDGIARRVSMDGLDPDIHAIHYDDATNDLDIEYRVEADGNKRGNSRGKGGFNRFEVFVQRWQNVPPPPPPQPPQPKDTWDDVTKAFEALRKDPARMQRFINFLETI